MVSDPIHPIPGHHLEPFPANGAASDKQKQYLRRALRNNILVLQSLPDGMLQLSMRHTIGYSSLETIGRASKIAELDLEACSNIRDLTPLNQLSLRKLNLGMCPARHALKTIEDILPNLEELHLDATPSRTWETPLDLTPLAACSRLKKLSLRHTAITNSSSLGRLVSLEQLDLFGPDLSADLESLKTLTNLKWLNLKERRISDISALGSLANLETLILHGCDLIADFSPLASLTKLRIVDLSLTKFDSLAPLHNSATSLEEVKLHDRQYCFRLASEMRSFLTLNPQIKFYPPPSSRVYP